LVKVNRSLTSSPLGKVEGTSRVALSPVRDGTTVSVGVGGTATSVGIGGTAVPVGAGAQAPNSHIIAMLAQSKQIRFNRTMETSFF
jgi:hypothetical protein